jgi:DNA modification methylase
MDITLQNQYSTRLDLNLKETTLHNISPYLGKINLDLARLLIEQYTHSGSWLYDPYSGSGTLPLEGWINGCNVIANDYNPYAFLLTNAKLNPILSKDYAMEELHHVLLQADKRISEIHIDCIPDWVLAFFNVSTLKETLALVNVLSENKSHFLLACLLGILHHQRPGFLSYPASHSVPYLRIKKFPKEEYPDLYNYRELAPRLENKITRALKKIPDIDLEIERYCYKRKAENFIPTQKIDTIITSPPYMKRLDYARDNRLRLWFLGSENWKSLDTKISPNEISFYKSFKKSLINWQNCLTANGRCILVVDDSYCKLSGTSFDEFIISIATREINGYKLIDKFVDPIPNEKRVRKGYQGSINEVVLVFKKR